MNDFPDPTGELSVAIADFLATAGPEDLAALRRAHRQAPAAWRDQAAAAAAEANRLAPHTAVGGQLRLNTYAGTPGWLLIGMTDAYARYGLGEAATCIHYPHPSRPQPVAAAAWRPGFVSCVACIPRHFKLAGRKAFVCDGCGREDVERMRAGRAVYGDMVFMFGVCRDCAPDVFPDEGAAGGGAGR